MGMVTTITLNQNKINAALMNMIISQRVYDSGVASTEIADKFRVDGTLYGDTKLYHSFDIGSPEDWLNDAEAADLLKLNRNKSGKTQAIVMGVYKMMSITTDQYLSKQAFMREGTFAEFTSFLKSSLRKIKKVYDNALIKSKLGTLEPSTDDCDITVTTPIGDTQEEQNRLEAQYIAKRMKVLKVDLADNNRKYNALDYLRAYNPSEMVAFWNVEVSSRLTMVDLPTIFHDDFDREAKFEQHELPQKWFGKALTDSDGTHILSPYSAYVIATDDVPASAPNPSVPKWTGGKLRIKRSGWYCINSNSSNRIIAEESEKPDTIVSVFGSVYKCAFLWAGDEVPKYGETIHDYVLGRDIVCRTYCWKVDDVYYEDPTIAFTLVHKDALPYMSGFETMTEFWNARSLTNNNYLIFGHNELEFLEEYPRIRVKVVLEETPSHTAPVRDVNIDKVGGSDVNHSSGVMSVNIEKVDSSSVSVDDNGLMRVAVSAPTLSDNKQPLDVNIAQIDDIRVDTGSNGVMSVNVRELDGNTLSSTDGFVDVNIAAVGGDAVDVPTGTATEVKITK